VTCIVFIRRFPLILRFSGFWEQEISMWRRLGKCCHNHWCGARNIKLIGFCQNIKHHRSWRITFQVAGTIVTKVRPKYDRLHCFHVGFEVLTAVTLKSTVFWDVTSCSAVGVHWHFGGIYDLHLLDQRVNSARSQSAHSARGLLGLLLSSEDGGDIYLFIYLLSSSYIKEPCPHNTRFFMDHRFDHIHLQTICI
jgi:hypothetical protein